MTRRAACRLSGPGRLGAREAGDLAAAGTEDPPGEGPVPALPGSWPPRGGGTGSRYAPGRPPAVTIRLGSGVSQQSGRLLRQAVRHHPSHPPAQARSRPACSRRHADRDTRASTCRSRRQTAIRSVIVTRTPCPCRRLFSKLDGLTRFLAPLLPAPQVPRARHPLRGARPGEDAAVTTVFRIACPLLTLARGILSRGPRAGPAVAFRQGHELNVRYQPGITAGRSVARLDVSAVSGIHRIRLAER